MSTLTRAAVYTTRIAAVTAAAPVRAGAATSAATAKLVGWELQQLARSDTPAWQLDRAGHPDSTDAHSSKARAHLDAVDSSR